MTTPQRDYRQTESLMAAIAAAKNRDEAGALYGARLGLGDEIDWSMVNRAILDRWSMAGLRYVKERAWRGER